MNWTHHARQAADSLMERIFQSAFVQGLAQGLLPAGDFAAYLYQDRHYLPAFRQAMEILGRRFAHGEPSLPSLAPTERPAWAALFQRFARDTVAAEEALQRDYFPRLPCPEGPLPAAGPVCTAYRERIVQAARTAPLWEALACILPCYQVYEEVGHYALRLHKTCAEAPPQDRPASRAENPYLPWLSLYVGADYHRDVTEFLAACNRLASLVSPRDQAAMTAQYLGSVDMELQFWTAYATE